MVHSSHRKLRMTSEGLNSINDDLWIFLMVEFRPLFHSVRYPAPSQEKRPRNAENSRRKTAR